MYTAGSNLKSKRYKTDSAKCRSNSFSFQITSQCNVFLRIVSILFQFDKQVLIIVHVFNINFNPKEDCVQYKRPSCDDSQRRSLKLPSHRIRTINTGLRPNVIPSSYTEYKPGEKIVNYIFVRHVHRFVVLWS